MLQIALSSSARLSVADEPSGYHRTLRPLTDDDLN